MTASADLPYADRDVGGCGGPKPHIAIVGGGIVGVVLTLGLIKQAIPVQLYEQAQGFRELGAGIAFSACARRCMELIDPSIPQALVRGGAVSISDVEDQDCLRWIDGYNQYRPDEPEYQKPLAQIGGAGFRGCRRDEFLEELSKSLPAGVIKFGKRLETIEIQADGKIILAFGDGTQAEATAVIGCDGIKSRVRKHMYGAKNEVSYPQFTHKVAYRALLPMTDALEVLGTWKANNFHHHVGPGAHMTHYPVANHKALNVVIVLSDPQPWPDHDNMVAEGSREKLEAALQDWHPTVLKLVRRLPDKLNTWALFDLGDYPLPRYNAGRICVAGDAAHATTPHHGAGACLGIEDALCLNILLGQVCSNNNADLNHAVEVAFGVFDKIRRPRTQWLVNSSRRACDLYHQQEWADPSRRVKAETCFEEMRDRSYKIWHFDVDDMVRQTQAEYNRRLLDCSVENGPGRKFGYVL
ncbi:hypothetical protein JX265_012679 [Neoarthrinium moseri]|uniref:FAD-binding domain-containing protein n=1 Tax=Neoarthrinium moseri TaxID=1658444 RepID=A0A9P9W9T9_9PEZI|nr:hypothetical protein JX266_011263 [Neoarthrinium moseri]KAI1853848.1 hypothetical protein JX265_012679 [Neoarthrinium moseri]